MRLSRGIIPAAFFLAACLGSTDPGTGDACQPACSLKACGPDGCGGVCGICPTGEACNVSTWECLGTCTPDCVGRVCGSDGCSGSCGSCPAGKSCAANGLCVVDCVPHCDGTTCGNDGCSGTCECKTGAHCDPATLRCL